MRRLLLLLKLRAVRGDIRYAESLVRHAEQQQRQIAAWLHDEEAIVCELATLPRRDWPSIAFASGIGAALAFLLAYGPSLVTRA